MYRNFREEAGCPGGHGLQHGLPGHAVERVPEVQLQGRVPGAARQARPQSSADALATPGSPTPSCRTRTSVLAGGHRAEASKTSPHLADGDGPRATAPRLASDTLALASMAAPVPRGDPAPSPGPGAPIHSPDPLGVPPLPGPGARGVIVFVFPCRLVVGDVSIIHPAAASYARGAARTLGFGTHPRGAISAALAGQAVQAGRPGLSRAAFISWALRELSVALCRGNASLCLSSAYVATRASGRTPMRGLAWHSAEAV
jgi:hypothetical protein